MNPRGARRPSAEKVPFSVDAHLLAELGERLVGRPAIALAELVKNSYDADASCAAIHMSADTIRVADDGHGMTLDEVRDGFLRVGTPRKEQRRFSPVLRRRLTGSKGVGRLATQMLGRILVLETRSSLEPKSPLIRLTINWDEGRAGANLTDFMAYVELPSKPRLLTTQFGTVIEITGLSRVWNTAAIEDLAREVWTLRSPFPREDVKGDDFNIAFESEEQSFVAAFSKILEGWIELYEARVQGELHLGHERYGGGHPKDVWRNAHIHLDLAFDDGEPARSHVFSATSDALGHAQFEIRVFDLRGRQPLGLTVNDVRNYLNRSGGVYLYDEGFRLPYYGPDADWLGTEIDHAHRLTRSKLLPQGLQVPGAQTYLPTMSRLFGVVNVSTSEERERAAKGVVPDLEHLQIQVSRDRLLDTQAYRTLRDAARLAVDLYANEKARRKLREAADRERQAEDEVDSTPEPLEVLDQVRPELPPGTYAALRGSIEAQAELLRARREVFERRAALLGTLATAGMTALAVEHEQARALARVEEIAAEMEEADDPALTGFAQELRQFQAGLDELRSPFATISDEHNRERAKLRADRVVKAVIASLESPLRNIDVEERVDKTLRLPEGSLAEWSALLQNVLMNASNAVLTQPDPVILITGSNISRRRRELLVLDNGVGVDLADAESLFEPFVRRLEIPAERRGLGLGGMGLGLTIVRTIAEALDCDVGFEEPPPNWRTAFYLRWTV